MKQHHRRPGTQEDISAACSLFLADQTQRCLWVRHYETPPTCTIDCNDIMTKYWWNLIWWCVHNPPNRQNKFPAKFSGPTVSEGSIENCKTLYIYLSKPLVDVGTVGSAHDFEMREQHPRICWGGSTLHSRGARCSLYNTYSLG